MGRSYCDQCKKTLRPIDLVPIISFFILRQKCFFCKKKISFIYPLNEFITGVLFIFSWLYLGQNYIEKIIFLGIISSLIVIFFSDAKYQIIPDSMQVTLFIFSLALLIIHRLTLQSFLWQIIAALVLMLPILFLFLITKGRGMGFGDVKFAFTMGLLLGIRSGILAMYAGFISGAIVGIVLIIFGKKGLKSKIAFGPFLVAGVIILLFLNVQINLLIKQIYGF